MTADVTDLNPDFRTKLDQLIAASGGRIYVVSGFRSVDQQQQLWNNAVAKYGSEAAASKWVAPPGHSNHNRGLAADLGGDIQLAHQLAPQFGLEFPMSWEDWHIEPTGTRSTATPQAYTTGPPGSPNPKQDPMLDASPPVLMASMTNALQGLMAGPSSSAFASGDVGTNTAGTTTAKPATSAMTAASAASAPAGSVEQGAGGDKRLPGHTLDQWISAVLSGVGAPDTPANREALTRWANTESGGYNPSRSGGRYNPLNTTEKHYGSSGEGGSQGNISDFGSFDQGVQNIVYNLTQTKGAGYEPIVAALRSGNDPNAVFSAVNGSAFGTHF